MELIRLIRRPPIAVPKDATVMEAVRVMVNHRVGAVVVTSGSRLEGIFTERDVMKKVVLHGMDSHETRMGEVMTRDVKKIAESATRHEALELMSENHIRHLPVVDEAGNVTGMISLRDILYDMVDDLEQQAAGLQNYAGFDGPGG